MRKTIAAIESSKRELEDLNIQNRISVLLSPLLKSAYHTVVDEEGWVGDIQKTEVLSVS